MGMKDNLFCSAILSNQVRRLAALPLLRRGEIERMWPQLRKFRRASQTAAIIDQVDKMITYMEKQWLKKNDHTNLWNFNKLSRVRSTNPGESYHSLLNK
jgi:hypothetical protein